MAKNSNKNKTHKESKKKSEEQKNNFEEPKNNFYSIVNTVEIEMKEHHERDARFVDKKLCFPWDCRKNGSFYKVFDCWKEVFNFAEAHFISYEEDEKTNALVSAIIRKEDGSYSYEDYYIDSNGDYRSEAVKNIIKECDLTICNPSGSEVKSFIPMVIGELGKYCLFLGSNDVCSYMGVECYLRDENNRLRVGYHGNFGTRFIINELDIRKKGYYNTATDETGEYKYCKPTTRWWWTNLPMTNANKRPLNFVFYEDLVARGLVHTYKNYEGIDIRESKDVPCDYFGVIGVPESFLKDFNYDEWEILDANDYRKPWQKEKPYGMIKDASGQLNEIDKRPRRILIRRKIKH